MIHHKQWFNDRVLKLSEWLCSRKSSNKKDISKYMATQMVGWLHGWWSLNVLHEVITRYCNLHYIKLNIKLNKQSCKYPVNPDAVKIMSELALRHSNHRHQQHRSFRLSACKLSQIFRLSRLGMLSSDW
jgi:hypothetical protein